MPAFFFPFFLSCVAYRQELVFFLCRAYDLLINEKVLKEWPSNWASPSR